MVGRRAVRWKEEVEPHVGSLRLCVGSILVDPEVQVHTEIETREGRGSGRMMTSAGVIAGGELSLGSSSTGSRES